ncbi:MAG: hypothetical protein IPO22_07135 [Anaerolineales bacterium]|nr:hypothetical protein [Anaerolineales bacterium]
MLQKFFGSRKSILLVFAGIFSLALLLLAWRIVSLQKAASEAVSEPVLKISYCGAEPEELCVLSFGRDVDENMVVNIFVPDRKFPDFYLKIKRTAGESVYECEKDKEVPTNVYCYGDMVNLQERMEISLFAREDERLIAAGDFTLKAILISESALVERADGGSAPEPTVDETPTTSAFFDLPTATATPTKTPVTSYPNSSYP